MVTWKRRPVASVITILMGARKPPGSLTLTNGTWVGACWSGLRFRPLRAAGQAGGPWTFCPSCRCDEETETESEGETRAGEARQKIAKAGIHPRLARTSA